MNREPQSPILYGAEVLKHFLSKRLYRRFYLESDLICYMFFCGQYRTTMRYFDQVETARPLTSWSPLFLTHNLEQRLQHSLISTQLSKHWVTGNSLIFQSLRLKWDWAGAHAHARTHTLRERETLPNFGSGKAVDACVLIIRMQREHYKYQHDATLTPGPVGSDGTEWRKEGRMASRKEGKRERERLGEGRKGI